MHFYLINPIHSYIAKVEGKPTLQDYYDLLGCRLITTVPLYETGDVFIADDEGLLGQAHGYTNIDQQSQIKIQSDHEHFIAGPIIYIGTDSEGDSITPEQTFQFMGRYATWHDPLFADPEKQSVSRITTFTGNGFGFHPEPLQIIKKNPDPNIIMDSIPMEEAKNLKK